MRSPKHLSLFLIALAIGWMACTGEMTLGDPNVEVKQLSLSADRLGALQDQACTNALGANGCSKYPNPEACDHLHLSVRGDGSIKGKCVIGSRLRRLTTVAEGIPFVCRLSWDSGCIQCQDIFDSAVVDTCDQEISTSTKKKFSDDTAFLPPGSESAPPGGGTGECDDLSAQMLYVQKINDILAAEGFSFSFQPALSQPLPSSSFFEEMAGQVCDEGTDAPGVQRRTYCDDDAEKQGRCFCEEEMDGDVECRCARITARVLLEACAEMPPSCDRAGWSRAVWSAYGATTKWLNQENPPDFGSDSAPNKGVATLKGPGDVECQGSPLVLDLAGDGIQLTSVNQGVRFNLNGSGMLSTGWVAGSDDALLALDRNNNGHIDHGGELFGEGSYFRDGFQALAELDQPRHGGNDNGIVEPADLMYDRVLLWTDGNQDGISQPEEMRPLIEAGVQALPVDGARNASVIDEHGNDLSLQGSFLRTDGTVGTMVDVYFVTRLP